MSELIAALLSPLPHHREIARQFHALSVPEQLRQLRGALDQVPEQHLPKLMALLPKELNQPWLPLPGPQTQALESPADVLLYGGAAGGGKTDLGLGAAITRHKRSLICRRVYRELESARDRAFDIVGTRDGYNSQRDVFRLGDGKQLQFFAAQYPGDERSQQGQPKDLLVIDEAAHWLESMVRYLMGWVRTTDTNQRTRTILCTNPPTEYEVADSDGGEWLIRMFAPWLDPGYADRAQPGELRWVISDEEGKDRWVEGPGEYVVEGLDDPVKAKSRTFIPAKVDDNPYLLRTDYKASLQAMPEPLRSAMLQGDWFASRVDNAFQVIPTSWVIEAQRRWKPQPPDDALMTTIGVDVAQGGSDETVLMPRYGSWYAMPKAHRGIDTKDGPAVAGLVFAAMRDGCTIAIDLGGGWGGSAYDHCKQQINNDKSEAVVAFNPSEASTQKARDGKIGFVNKRAEVWWKFREALDPETGAHIALPPDPQLVADLTVPRWKCPSGKYQIESKDDIKKRLGGRSPDRGDAAVIAWHYGHEQAILRSMPRPLRAIVGTRGYKSRFRH